MFRRAAEAPHPMLRHGPMQPEQVAIPALFRCMSKSDLDYDPPKLLADTREGHKAQKRVALIMCAAAFILLIIALIWWATLQSSG